MSKNGYKSNVVRSKFAYRSNNTNNIQANSSQYPPQVNNLEEDADFFSPISNQEQAGRIIHQSTEHSYDDMGNRVVTTKTIRELDNMENKNKNFNQKSYTSKNSQISKQDKKSGKYRRVSKYTNAKNEVEKQRALYSSPDFQSGSPYDSPIYMNDLKNQDGLDEEQYKENYLYEARNLNDKNMGQYVKTERYEYVNNNANRQFYESSRDGSPEAEIISPVGYIANYSSGSEIEDNQMKSFDNYQTSGINDNNYYLNRVQNNRNLNYEMEDPEGFDYLRNNERNRKRNYPQDLKNAQYLNRSDYRKRINDDSYQSDRKDFQSPDRNINREKRFRNVTVGMIDSKGPTNDDRKVTKIMTSKIVTQGNKVYEEKMKKTKVYKNKQPKDKNNLTKVDAAKIIQAWWRRRYAGEEEVYDITVKKAIKLQSFIRGFLVRKKVLRYITLAIYYQSFCDKLQDVLCSNVKREIFYYLIRTFLPEKYKDIKDRNFPTRPINNNINNNMPNMLNIPNMPNNTSISKREMIVTQTKRTTQQNISQNFPQNRNYNTFKDPTTNRIIKTNNYTSNTQRTYIQSPISYPSPIPYTNQSQINYRSPDTYVSSRKTDVRIYHISPDIYNRNKNYKQILNRSFDNNINERLNIQNTTTRNIYNNYSRVENVEDRERNISPAFGVLSQNKTTIRKVLRTNYSNADINNRKKLFKTDSNQNITSTTRTTKRQTKIITSKKANKIPVKKTKTTTKRKKIVKNVSRTNKNENQIISGGTLSIVKLPNRKINNSESEDVYTRIRKFEKIEKYGTENRESRFRQPNEIDNQLSINIVKIPSERDILKKNKKVREEYVRYIEKPVEVIKEKEKIIIQKEPKPETTEEGNDVQNFDMKIKKIVAMSIEASTETKEIIKDEIKEIEIFKKREREKNKQINKYKKDIEFQKLKNKYDKLKGALRIIDYWKNRLLNKKFKQYKNNCSPEPVIYEVEVGADVQIAQKPKEKQDCAIQYEIEKVDEGSQAFIQIEEKKPIKNFDILKISKNRSISFEQKIKKKKKPENRITKSKLNIISKIPKKEFGQQSEPWETQISKIRGDINILYSKPETVEGSTQYPHYENIIDETNQIQIVQDKPELVDMEIQHEPEDNYIDKKKVVIEINGSKPKVVESITQYEKQEPKIYKNSPISIFGEKKEEKIIIKAETVEAETNTFNETVEQGVNAVIEEEPKPKNIEVQIRTVKRSLAKMEIPILKKLWLRKAFKTFRDNCNRPEYHKIIGREILRMALLKWRFIKGYGPDRYGNAYDRDGNLLYKTKAKVADSEVQQEFIVEKEDQSTQYIPIDNIISTLKQIEIGPSYKKKVEPEKVDQAVGDNIKMGEIIQRGEIVSYRYKKKEKAPNKIAKNQRLEIKKIQKSVREQGTEMPVVQNKISKLEKLNISGNEYKLRNQKNLRTKELLIQMIYRKMMGDKLALSDALRQWLKQTLLLLQEEQFNFDRQKRRFTSISKNDRFALIEEIKKIEMGTQIQIADNKIVAMPNINIIRKKEMKDSEVSVDIHSKFDFDQIRPKNENKLTFKSSKKPVVLETHKENDMNIYGQDYIFKEEIKKGVHHPMTEESKNRVTEILIKYFTSRGGPNSILKKYFRTWRRKANYLTYLDQAKIIQKFIRYNLNKTENYRKWKKVCERLIFREKIKLIKLSKIEDYRRNKIFDLIRLTRINSVLAKRRYLHYIILCWLAYTRNMNKKRKHVKNLYEIMLNTYMHMADDVFGNNQKENPSVQDALFEAVETDKFQTKEPHDVPLADKYYVNKKEIKKVTTNITIVNNTNNDTEPKEYVTYKAYVSRRPIPTSASSGNIKDKVIKEKVIKVSPGERLQSRGRGRKYRTKVEKEILSKFYNEKVTSKNKNKENEEEKEDEEGRNVNILKYEKKYERKYDGKNDGKYVGKYEGNYNGKYEGDYDFDGNNDGNLVGNKSYNIRITTNKTTNNLGGSYNYSNYSMNITKDKDLSNSVNLNKKEMNYRKRRALFGRYSKEDEKEMEDEK